MIASSKSSGSQDTDSELQRADTERHDEREQRNAEKRGKKA